MDRVCRRSAFEDLGEGELVWNQNTTALQDLLCAGSFGRQYLSSEDPSCNKLEWMIGFG
jgi:hypothetical protein